MPDKDRDLTTLTAISPLDGRYRYQVEDLVPYASELALIRKRTEIEGRYLVALSEAGVTRPLTEAETQALKNLGPEMTVAQAERVKQIEVETRHDVKAVERAMRELVAGTSLEDLTEMIHFGLTTWDINNLAYTLMLDGARREVCLPSLRQVVDKLGQMAGDYQDMPMLARTHGQPAVPTTLGKELVNMAVRLHRQTGKLAKVRLTGKLNGAVGNFNAHVLAAPGVDWPAFSSRFVASLGLEPNLVSTQINPYEDMIELFQALMRVNGVILDIDQDIWRYISDNWFIQSSGAGEVGSSTMPQKVNPINFENSEGNVQLANSLWEGISRKLAVSRLQRDLSDSTVIRNVGMGLGYGVVAYQNTLSGLNRIRPHPNRIQEELDSNWAILGEGAQTVLRKSGITDPYSEVAKLVKGRHIDQAQWQEWVSALPVSNEIRITLINLTPQSYLGLARELVTLALEELKSAPD